MLAGIATILLAAAFGLPAFALYDDEMAVPAVILAAIGIYAVTFASVFFNVALPAAAAQVLDGRAATVSSGVTAPVSRVPRRRG